MTTTQLVTPTIHTDNSKPLFTDHRLSVIRWKATKENPKPHAAVCVSIPRITVAVEPAILQSALQVQMDEMQDAVVRSLIEGYPNKLQPFNVKRVESEAVAEWAAQQNESKRLSKEAIEKWFDQYVADQLLLALANKSGISDPSPEQLKQLENNCNSARTMIASLASPRSMYPVNTLNQLQKVILLTEENGKEMAEQLQTKITALLQPKQVTLDLNL